MVPFNLVWQDDECLNVLHGFIIIEKTEKKSTFWIYYCGVLIY